MKHFLNVLYFHYFLFYKNVIKDDAPYFTTVLSLSASQGFLINGVMDIIALKYFCYEIRVWMQLTILAVLIYLNYLAYYKDGKAKEIIKEKPMLHNNKSISIIISWLFFLITLSWLFWGPIYGKYLLGRCR